MDKLKRYITDWAVNYEKHRDMIKKEIEKLEIKEDEIAICLKERKRYILVIPKMEDAESLRVKIKELQNVTVVTINSKDNLQFIIDNWKKFTDIKGLAIIFINPFSNTDNKWIIKPYVHQLIAENKALKKGLKSMFSMVEPITEKEFLKNIE